MNTVNRLAADFLGVATPPRAEDSSPDYTAAFDAWRTLLGADHVHHDEETCREYAKTTLPKGTRPAGILRPSSTDQVRETVEIASRYGVPLHAISRGKNWGYGDACAATDGQVIVELTRMNQIREVNVDLGYAVIEAGVSQGQLYDYLCERNLPLLLDITGAGPNASIVGNILQRGFGHTPYGDRFKHTCGLEVVLPDGRLINTGFGQFDNAKASRVFPGGLGPWIDGLFTQSSYGIVTSACIWLMPRPAAIEAFLFQVDEKKLDGAISAIRRLRMAQTVRSTIHIANELRVISAQTQYPWSLAEGQTPLPESVLGILRKEHVSGEWNGLGGLYGSRSEVRAAKRRIRQEFRGVTRVFFFGRRELALIQRYGRYLNRFRWARRLTFSAASAESVVDLLEGIPTAKHITGVNSRRETEAHLQESTDPRTSGLIWASPVIPATPQDVRSFLRIARPIFKRFRFDLLVTFSSVSERSLCCVTSINYDKSDPADAERGAECYEQLMAAFTKEGYYPYRRSSIQKACS